MEQNTQKTSYESMKKYREICQNCPALLIGCKGLLEVNYGIDDITTQLCYKQQTPLLQLLETLPNLLEESSEKAFLYKQINIISGVLTRFEGVLEQSNNTVQAGMYNEIYIAFSEIKDRVYILSDFVPTAKLETEFASVNQKANNQINNLKDEIGGLFETLENEVKLLINLIDKDGNDFR